MNQTQLLLIALGVVLFALKKMIDKYFPHGKWLSALPVILLCFTMLCMIFLSFSTRAWESNSVLSNIAFFVMQEMLFLGTVAIGLLAVFSKCHP